mgnify:CR=1 FL=1
MFDDESYNELKNIINIGDFVIDSHNKIYSLILQGKSEDTTNIESYVENRCDDIESSKELAKIKEHVILDFADKNRLIKDYIHEVKNFKLKLQIDDLKKKQKVQEKEGKIEESIKIAIELTKLSKALKMGERG